MAEAARPAVFLPCFFCFDLFLVWFSFLIVLRIRVRFFFFFWSSSSSCSVFVIFLLQLFFVFVLVFVLIVVFLFRLFLTILALSLSLSLPPPLSLALPTSLLFRQALRVDPARRVRPGLRASSDVRHWYREHSGRHSLPSVPRPRRFLIGWLDGLTDWRTTCGLADFLIG